MSGEKLDAVIEEQERVLRFRSIDLDTIYRVCCRAVERLKSMKAPCYIRAVVNKTVVFAQCLEGASCNNEEWAKRKAALCERYWMSSLHAARNLEKKGQTLETCGMNSTEYGLSGGSFPILLESGLCIGSITVSGLKGEEDHQIVVSAIADELGVEIPSVLG